jgi:hypothetical protein
MTKNTLLPVIFDDLSIIEIVTYMGDSTLCSQKMQYFKYGRDHRAAWDALSKNEEHYEFVCNKLGLLTDAKKEIKQASKVLYKLLDPDQVELKQVEEVLENHFPVDWFLFPQMDAKTNDQQFEMFEKSLFDLLETLFIINANTWQMKLIRWPKDKKKMNKALVQAAKEAKKLNR